MKILKTGKAIRADSYGMVGEANVDTPIASVTFSGLSTSPRLALNIDWKHAGLGTERLDLQFEGIGAPAGSTMVRNQLGAAALSPVASMARTDPGFTAIDLNGTVLGANAQAAVYALCDAGEHTDPTYVLTEGYAQDGSLIVTDTEMWSQRQGRWNAVINGFTVVTLTVGSGRSQINANSHIQAFNAN